MRNVIITFLAVGSLFSQPTPTYFVARTGAVSLSSAATTATVQQPATNGELIAFTKVVATCPAACTITQTQNATAVTASSGTAGTVVGTDPTSGASFLLTFWTAVTLSGGTVTNAFPCSAACTQAFDISAIKFGNTGTSTNYSVTISSVTGTAYIDFYGYRQ
jgi:hypothetical protein